MRKLAVLVLCALLSGCQKKVDPLTNTGWFEIAQVGFLCLVPGNWQGGAPTREWSQSGHIRLRVVDLAPGPAAKGADLATRALEQLKNGGPSRTAQLLLRESFGGAAGPPRERLKPWIGKLELARALLAKAQSKPDKAAVEKARTLLEQAKKGFSDSVEDLETRARRYPDIFSQTTSLAVKLESLQSLQVEVGKVFVAHCVSNSGAETEVRHFDFLLFEVDGHTVVCQFFDVDKTPWTEQFAKSLRRGAEPPTTGPVQLADQSDSESGLHLPDDWQRWTALAVMVMVASLPAALGAGLGYGAAELSCTDRGSGAARSAFQMTATCVLIAALGLAVFTAVTVPDWGKMSAGNGLMVIFAVAVMFIGAMMVAALSALTCGLLAGLGAWLGARAGRRACVLLAVLFTALGVVFGAPGVGIHF